MDIKRDSQSGAIINTDKEALNKYKLERRNRKIFDKVEKDIEEIQKCISSISRRLDIIEQR
tara:strand:+ start:425 stop:607 length:183 start_codon:yes stop_codon:yes gene_type:complete